MIYLSTIMKRPLLFLGIIVLLGFFLRVYNLHDNVFFAYDQARDATRIYEMIYEKDIKLVGPETDIPGVFNGPLLYYLLLPVYLFTNFNPHAGALLMIIINLTGIVSLFFIGKTLFNEKAGLLAALTWALAYEQINFSRYISNTGLTPTFCLIFFLGIVLYRFGKKEIGFPISVIGWVLSVHVNFYLIYLVLFYFMYPPKWNKKMWGLATISGLLLYLPFLLAEIKFKFLGITSLLSYFDNQKTAGSIAENMTRYIHSMSEYFYYTFFSFNNFLGFLIIVGVLIYAWKKIEKTSVRNFLFIWFFSTLPLFAFKSGVLTSYSIQSSIMGAGMVICALAVHCLVKEKKWLYGIFLIAVVVLSNFYLLYKEGFKSANLTAYQHMLYGEQKAVMDYTYVASGGKPFSICVVTNPLFYDTTWSALYKFYGEKKYGALPYWTGQKQVIHKTFLTADSTHVPDRFLIVEAMDGIEENARLATIYMEDKKSRLVETKKFGNIEVQKRKLLSPGEVGVDTLSISPEQKGTIVSIVNQDPRYSCFN